MPTRSQCSTVPIALLAALIFYPFFSLQQALSAEPVSVPASFSQLSHEYCSECHSGSDAEARLDLRALEPLSIDRNFFDWRRVASVLSDGSMPPQDAQQPESAVRQQASAELNEAVHAAMALAADDPGPTALRRLTNAEYENCIEDLTGLRLDLSGKLLSDSVGSSGFTNSATGQFMQDASLERYLEVAKIVAEHAVLGAGPMHFYPDAGQTGMELSAISRIQKIYRQYGFRSSAGEGAEPFGLDRFPRAFAIAWKYRYRRELGNEQMSLEALAAAANVEPKFALHIWNELQRHEAKFPMSEIISAWQAFPKPQPASSKDDIATLEREVSQLCVELQQQIEGWQRRFAGSASDEEEAALLTDVHFDLPESKQFAARGLRKRVIADDTFTPDLNNPKHYSADGRVRFKLTVEPASRRETTQATVIFCNPQFRFRAIDLVQPAAVPLNPQLKQECIEQLRFGQNPGGEQIAESDFVVRVGESKFIEVDLPADCRSGELLVEAKLDRQLGRDSVVRCSISDVTNERVRDYSTLLRDPASNRIDQWELGLHEFARALPQISHREPTPSDRDPIPEPYDNAYNLPERNYFHTAVKYYRDDDFLVKHILPDQATAALDMAWADLLTSFDYHNVNLRFSCKKFGIELHDRRIESLDEEWLKSLDQEPRRIISAWKTQFDAMQSQLAREKSQHVEDVLRFASQAWRCQLKPTQREQLTDFYLSKRDLDGLAHPQAIRATLVRVLLGPEFLYRIEKAARSEHDQALSGFELASRLSFSIWSSGPDEELLQLAATDDLLNANVIEAQVQRMLASPKAQQLAVEFFGQWLGFYQFDQYRGVDPRAFPEFDEGLRNSLYQEAIMFFEHIVRSDRPYTELIHADYTFLDQRTAKHYGFAWDGTAPVQQQYGASQRGRGGLLGLGAILTVTSAPLRTSPVKRGDWILRRLIGTPVPPPPADVGSIPAEEILADGQTARSRLEAHRNRSECMSCHSRIDPLGFSLENYDALGRWRDHYGDSQIIDASGVLRSGQSIVGPAGLKAHLKDMDGAFRITFATKLVAYFLGRAETLEDAALIERISIELEKNPNFSTAIKTLVLSPQFQRIRGSQSAADKLVDVRVQP